MPQLPERPEFWSVQRMDRRLSLFAPLHVHHAATQIHGIPA